LMTQILTTEELKAGVRKIAEIKPIEEKLHIAVPIAHLRASPLAKKIATEKGVNLSTIKGTGPEGAITREDVEKAMVEKASAKTISMPSASENIRMAVAAAMSKSNREIPHYYLQTKADMSLALKWLADENKKRSVNDRLLPVVLFIKATAHALTEVPELNAWWDNGLQLKKGIHIGFVVSLRTGGILVPAIRDADQKSPDDIMKTLSDMIPRARNLKLRSSELTDSTITITSLGEGAVETVYGVIYPPQVALVSFGGITEQPYAENRMIGIKPVVNIGLAADHRATDGNTGNLFLTALKNYLMHPEKL